MSLAIKGTILIFFSKQAINSFRRSKTDTKIDTYCQVDTRVLGNLGVE